MFKQRLNTIYSHIISKIIFAIIVCESYIGNAFSDEVDPAAPIPVLKKARDIAQQSNINQESATSLAGIVGNILVAIAGAVGLGYAIQAGAKLYKNIQDGDQSRHSNGSLVMSLIVGAVITIMSVIVSIIVNFVM